MIYCICFTNDRSKVKIGYTKDIRARLTALQTGNPAHLELLWLCPEGSIAEEKALHRHFSQEHHRGEWFDGSVLARLAEDFLCV